MRGIILEPTGFTYTEDFIDEATEDALLGSLSSLDLQPVTIRGNTSKRILVGLGAPSGQGTLVAGWYLGLTAMTLACAYAGRGLRRSHGALIISGYLAFVVAVLIAS
jgi:hypothetical protein